MPPSLSIMPHTRGLLTMDGCAMQNFGYTVEQEGDSFALVFEEPSDAVKFCLQVSACERNEVAYRTNFLPQLQPLGALSWLTPASRHSCHHPRRPQAQQSLARQKWPKGLLVADEEDAAYQAQMNSGRRLPVKQRKKQT